MSPEDRRRKRKQLTELKARLAKGWEVINVAPDLNTRSHHEDFWLTLLKQYERLADDLAPPL